MVIELLKEVLFICHKFSWRDWTEIAVIVFAPIVIIAWVIRLFILPIICEYYIVPEIEKKTGKKLGYNIIVNYLIGGKFFYRCGEISRYILCIYSQAKKNGKKGWPEGNWRLALKYSGYNIDMVTKKDLCFAYCYKIFGYIMLISLAICFVASCFL